MRQDNIVAVCLRAFGLQHRTELASEFGVTKSAVRFWENRNRLPPDRIIQAARMAREKGIGLPAEFYEATGLPDGNGRDKDAA